MMTATPSLSRAKGRQTVRRSTAALLLAGGAALALTAGPAAAATFNFTGASSDNLEDASSWTLDTGTPATNSPPPANGDIGVVSSAGEIDGSIYDPGTDSPPGAINVVAGGTVRFVSGVNDEHNFVLDGGTLASNRGRGRSYGGTTKVKSDSFASDSSGGMTFIGQIQDFGPSATGQLAVVGQVNLYSDNSGFTGGFDVQSGGLLEPHHENAFGTGDTVVGSGGQIDFSEQGGIYAGALVLDGGSIYQSLNRGVTATVRLRSDSTFIDDGRAFTLNGPITDDGANAGKLIYNGKLKNKSYGAMVLNATNTYTGGTEVGGEGTGVSGTKPSTPLKANAVGALGFGDVQVDANGSLLLNVAGALRATQNLIVDKNSTQFGQVELHRDQTVASLILGGTSIGDGTYDATSNVNGVDFSNYFTGGDSITVLAVPEPASLALMGLGGGLMMLRRRRRGAPEA